MNWIYIHPDSNSSSSQNAWTGSIEEPINPKDDWKFELIRHVEPRELFSVSPFDKKTVVCGLLDYQRQCTLYRPRIFKQNPGSFGGNLYLRTIVKGSFDALLINFSINDPTENIFDEISFDSQAFNAWYQTDMFERKYDHDKNQPSIEFKTNIEEDIHIPDLGRVNILFGTELSRDSNALSIKTASNFRLIFDGKASLDKIYEISIGLEYLFGFLIGHRTKPPLINVWKDKKSGTLDISGRNWLKDTKPEQDDCIHVNGIGGVHLGTIVQNFLKDRFSLITRMYAIDYCRHFSRNINDKFAFIMPALEEYLRIRYTEPDEISYLAKERAFFELIDSQDDIEIQNFVKKHISIKKSKKPSLKTLIGRAISELSQNGFNFPPSSARSISDRRGKAFHSVPSISDDEARLFYEDVCVSVGILMFLTYLDLGIDIRDIAERWRTMPDMMRFVHRPGAGT